MTHCTNFALLLSTAKSSCMWKVVTPRVPRVQSVWFSCSKVVSYSLQMGRNFTQGALLGSFTFLEWMSWLQFANARWSKLFYFGSGSIFLAFIAVVIWPSVVLYNEETGNKLFFWALLLVFLCCSPEFYLLNSWRMMAVGPQQGVVKLCTKILPSCNWCHQSIMLINWCQESR